MIRRSSGWLEPGDGDRRLDELLAGAWEEGTAALAGALDLAAGKAALLAIRHQQETSAWPDSQGTVLAAARDHIDAMLAEVTAALSAGPGPAQAAAGVYLITARQFLIQLRAGLIRRTMPKTRALQLVSSIRHSTTEADRALRQLPPASSRSAAQEIQQLTGQLSSLQQQVPGLSGAIERLFNEAGDLHPRVPVPSR